MGAPLGQVAARHEHADREILARLRANGGAIPAITLWGQEFPVEGAPANLVGGMVRLRPRLPPPRRIAPFGGPVRQ